MTTSNLYTTTWRCSCNYDNSLARRQCQICGDAIPVGVLEQVYQEEIRYQNVEHAEEERKRKIILLVIAGVSLIYAPFLYRLLVWVFALILFLVGTIAGMLCIVNEYKKINKTDDYNAYGYGVVFFVSILCYRVLVSAIGAWINASTIMVGIMSVCWIVFAVIHSIRVVKHGIYLSMPLDIVWCGVRILLLVFIFVQTINY